MRHLAACAAVGALALAGQAEAQRLPTALEGQKIRRAIRTVFAHKAGVPVTRIVFNYIRVGTVDRRFARADVQFPGPEIKAWSVVLVRSGNGWKVRQYTNAKDIGRRGNGCGLPLPVRVDLVLSDCHGKTP